MSLHAISIEVPSRDYQMLELELENAILRAYPHLLPDLYADGYQIKSSQAVLLGRRLDIQGLFTGATFLRCLGPERRDAPLLIETFEIPPMIRALFDSSGAHKAFALRAG